MQIAITGSSGFIGAALVRRAVEQGHEVVALVRETSRRDHIEDLVSRFVVGTHDEPHARAALLEGTDVVVHNSFDWPAMKDFSRHLQGNLVGSLDFLKESGDRHFIYMSSIAVHHFMHDRWEGVIDESHPGRPGNDYGALKAAIEAHMWSANASTGQAVTAIRPCGVYGIDPRTNRSIGWPFIERIRRGEAFERKGGGKFVHVDDVAAATIAAVDNPAASPAVYNLVDCYARWCDWAQVIANRLGVELDIDDSSPSAPKNMFDTSATVEDLGVSLDRGFDGITRHIDEMIALGA